MTIGSMTGFAESTGSHDGLRWRWEAKSVNGRSLELRLRTPPGFDSLEQPGRMLAAERFRRGNFQISLTVEADSATRGLTVDPVALASAVKLAREVAAETGLAPASGALIPPGEIPASLSKKKSSLCDFRLVDVGGRIENPRTDAMLVQRTIA